jgi:Ser/Thr protein kinase RdoA (MazF antagonist)
MSGGGEHVDEHGDATAGGEPHHRRRLDPLAESLGAPEEAGGRAWQTFDREEMTAVLARFDVGRIEIAREYRRGSRSSPKLKLHTERGEFLLKRRSLARHPIARIRFAHALQAALARQSFPVAPLQPDRTTGDTLLVSGEFAYELFRFVAGDRCDKSGRATAKAGEMLARLHRIARDIDGSIVPPASFHQSTVVRTAISRLVARVGEVDQRLDERRFCGLVASVSEAYERSVDEIRDLGFESLKPGIVHGDWHPGNLIFAPLPTPLVAAVIDFDSARSEPRVTEVANGMAQFAIRGEPGTSPLQWPADFDAKRFQAFLHGYLAAADRPLTLEERSMLPWMMIEALIAESAVPIANEGTFGELPGAAFTELVFNKCEWIRQHRKAIAAL